MRKYKEDIKNYISKENQAEEDFKIGESLPYLPFEETDANFCDLKSIQKSVDSWDVVLKINNEFTGETYFKPYTVNIGTKIELNVLEMPIMCFLPPDKVPVLVEVTSISEEVISLKIVGILQEFADDIDKKRSASLKTV